MTTNTSIERDIDVSGFGVIAERQRAIIAHNLTAIAFFLGGLLTATVAFL